MADKKTKEDAGLETKTPTAKKPTTKPVEKKVETPKPVEKKVEAPVKEEAKVELTRDKVEEVKESRKPKKEDGKFYDKHGKEIGAARARNMGLDRKKTRKDSRTK